MAAYVSCQSILFYLPYWCCSWLSKAFAAIYLLFRAVMNWLREVKLRLDALENSQKAMVDSALEQLKHYIRALTLTKERAHRLPDQFENSGEGIQQSEVFLEQCRIGLGFLISSLNNSCVLCWVIKRMRRYRFDNEG